MEVHQLAEAFFSNSYYSHPRPADLSENFPRLYLEAHPKESKEAAELAEAFLLTTQLKQNKAT